MEMREFVTFEADFPSDTQWDAGGNLLVPGGKAIIGFLAGQMQRYGFTASHPVQHSFYGWAIDVETAGARFWCMVQYPGPWLLLTERRPSISDRLLGRSHTQEHQELLECLHGIMKADKRFSSIKWYTRQQYWSGAHAVFADAP
jgi:hypothetical protein